VGIPVAAITGTRSERFKAWLVRLFAPPRGFTNSSPDAAMWYWSATGAMAAGLALGAMVLIYFDALLNVNMAVSLAWAVFLVLGIPVFILPFMISFSLVRYVQFPSRYVGAAYGAVFHVLAHCGVLYALEVPSLSFPVILAPLLVGSLWGSWLPAALAKPHETHHRF